MNPEVRFRVPPNVYDRAERRSDELGLSGSRGRSGGVSELARAGLYLLLGLPLPQDSHQLQSLRFEDARLARRGLEGEEARVGLRLLHRVDPEVRRRMVLEQGQPIPATVTTRFEFSPGEVPEELNDWFQLTESGLPVGELDLSGGALSSGTLVSARPEASLEEVLAVVGQLNRSKTVERERRRRREKRRQAGEAELGVWVEQHGSPHARALREEGFEWVERAEREFAEARLARLNVADVRALSSTQSLTRQAEVPGLIPLASPSLESIERLRSLRARLQGEPDLELSLVGRADDDAELVLITVGLPTGGAVHFLSPDHPSTPYRKGARPVERPKMQSLRGD